MDTFTIIQHKFEECADQEKALKMAKYLKNQFVFYGISSLERKETYKDILKEEKKKKRIDWELLDQCYRENHREFQYFVLDYLHAMCKYITFDDIDNLKKYISVKQWWDTIDSFHSIFGTLGLRDDRVKDVMLEWSKSDDLWFRRIAIIHQLSRKDKTDVDVLEEILMNNFGSKEFFINKAIGWSLREYS